MAPSVPRTRAAAAIRMKQIVLDNQSRMIRHLRTQLATARQEADAIKEEHKANQLALKASHKVIAGLTEIGLSMSKKIEMMKAKKQKAKENHVALVEEKDGLLQIIQGLQEANGAFAPFDDEWEEEPEEEEIEEIPLGEGEIDDE
ncbi:hypothetical protein F511_33781 [Dorcoceras hygrometricum]|uniref:Uncharacterized protein n=1 Tax=Dorcoceras hygrometricum TaxID=472368 RepID=A0A2Z7CTI9_9LAMI|nr:hypothetical protein F511_33781 [Dorcoceras hygrometricum]